MVAIRAAQPGMKSAVVEKDALGGVCLNRGCIPTKALLHCADLGRVGLRAKSFGWDVTDYSLNLAGVVNHAQLTAERLNGKALAVGESQGLIKTVFDTETGEIPGVHMIGEGVTEIINCVSVAMTLECTEEFLMRTLHAHPGLSEMSHESTLEAFGRAMHQ